jgi:hypothetical protein
MVPFEVPSAHSQGSSSEIGADFGASASARCEVQAPAIQLDSDEDDDDIAMAAACFAAWHSRGKRKTPEMYVGGLWR